LSDGDFKQVSPELRANILAFYRNPDAPLATKRKAKDWKRIQDELEQLKAAAVSQANSGANLPSAGSSGILP